MHICTIKGMPIRIHYSLFIFVSLILSYIYLTSGLAYTKTIFCIFFALFSSVLMHELGHALMAKRFSMETKSITLYPFGGIAMIRMNNLTSKSEILIALAGPLTNLLLSAISIPLILLNVPLSIELFSVNVIMCVFNMIPAFPMDGGRVLRGILSYRLDRDVATIYCIRLSGLFLLLFILIGFIFKLPSLILVGFVLMFMVSSESKRLGGPLKNH